MRDTGILRFSSQSSLIMPAEVGLEDDMLCWGTGRYGRHSPQKAKEYHAQFAARPVAGVLRDFIGLADAAPERVLAFARARGVLGIDPLVTALWQEGDERFPFADDSFDYIEPVAGYTGLAAHFAGILRIMGAIKAGRKIDDGDLFQCIRGRWGLRNSDSFPPSLKHELLWLTVSECWDQATIKLMPSSISPLAMIEPENPYPFFTVPHSREITIKFGEWRDGHDWDREHSLQTRPGDMIALPEWHEGRDTGDRSSGEWLKPYRDYATEDFYALHAGSRPSALYGALVFQLLQELTLEEDTYFCSQCARAYPYDPDRARKPAKGEDPKDWGNSKPREDRATAFCSELCRGRYKTEDKQRRRAARKRKDTQERPAGH